MTAPSPRPTDRLILALDLPDEAAALAWARRMRGRVGMFKIGFRLFTAAGPSLVGRIAEAGGPVFLDLKYHDIPNTVGTAVREAARLGAALLTVHASGGAAMLRAASEAADRAAREGDARPRVLAVTVLTSLTAEDLCAAGIVRTVEEQVVALGEMAWQAGCDGLVASPRELGPLRSRLGASPLLVTPGIRPPGSPADDQSRTATPADAVRAGADYLVIGRPVLDSPDPDAAVDALAASLADL